MEKEKVKVTISVPPASSGAHTSPAAVSVASVTDGERKRES